MKHVHSLIKEGPTNTLSKNKLLLLAMTLHNIPEGLAVGIAIASVKTNLVPALILSIGIGIQNFPEGTAISLPLHESGISRFSKVMMYGQYSALVEIPSALLGFLFAQLLGTSFCFKLCSWSDDVVNCPVYDMNDIAGIYACILGYFGISGRLR